LTDLDEKTNGFQAGDMILVAARPSIGKTAFGLFVAWNASKYVPVGFISAEMGNTALGHRLLAMVSKIDSQAMRRGRLTQSEKDQIGYAAVTIGPRPIYLSDRLREPGQIAREARRLKQQHGIGLLIVDYLQLLEGVKGRKADNREQEVSAISRAIKSTATSLNIPVVALAQLNRKAEDRGDKRPQLSDLRDSGSLEQDADIVILLHRPAKYGVLEVNGEDVSHLVEAHIAKQRNGPTGTVRLYFDETTGMFGNWGGRP
jgi:replicative DNA helicase